MFNFLFIVFIIILLALPAIGFLDGIKYKEMENKYLDSARWSDGK